MNGATSDAQSRLRALFVRLAAAPEAERAALLRTVESDDPALARDVSRLLKGAEREDGFLEEPLLDAAARERLLGARHAEELPEQVGPYRLGERLGEGAAGVVFRGYTTTPIED